MYGLIGKMLAFPGHRDALMAAMLEDVGELPGCRSFVVAADPADGDALWITEVWDSEESHKASLDLPAVRESIGRAMPLIASFAEQIVTRPVGGIGLLG